MATKRTLTDEQKEKLHKAVRNLIGIAVWGYDWDIDEDNFDEIVQEELIEPFIIPLMNGEEITIKE